MMPKNAQTSTKVAEPRPGIVGIGKEQKFEIELGGEACKRNVTTSKRGCNTCEK